MKIRNGFVSNSSSSSFVLVTSLEYWEEVKKDLHPYAVAVAEAIMSKPRNFHGIQIVSFSTWESHGSGWTEYLHVDFDGDTGEYEDSAYEAWEDAEVALRRSPDKIFIESVELG